MRCGLLRNLSLQFEALFQGNGALSFATFGAEIACLLSAAERISAESTLHSKRDEGLKLKRKCLDEYPSPSRTRMQVQHQQAWVMPPKVDRAFGPRPIIVGLPIALTLH